MSHFDSNAAFDDEINRVVSDLLSMVGASDAAILQSLVGDHSTYVVKELRRRAELALAIVDNVERARKKEKKPEVHAATPSKSSPPLDAFRECEPSNTGNQPHDYSDEPDSNVPSEPVQSPDLNALRDEHLDRQKKCVQITITTSEGTVDISLPA